MAAALGGTRPENVANPEVLEQANLRARFNQQDIPSPPAMYTP
jgi:hypothetical protein